MKNNITHLLSGFLLCICLAFTPSLKAQVLANPYPVFNDNICPIKISYQIYKTTSGCTACSASGSTGTQIINPGANFNIVIPTACTPFCNIAITLLEVDNFPLVPPITVTIANNTVPVFGSCSSPDCPTFSITWAVGGTTFN